MTEPRSLEQRTADVREKVRTDVDLWVASADAAGNAYPTQDVVLVEGPSPEDLAGRAVMRDGGWLAS